MKKDKIVWIPRDLEDMDYERDIGFPGEFPYLRGCYAQGYRSRLWTMRQFAGYGLAEDTNRRLKFLLANGETGLSIAFDYHTLYGLDHDAVNRVGERLGVGESGKTGVAIDTIEDMERLFEGIDIGDRDISVSMTINAPACALLAMYYVVARRRGIDPAVLRGTIQNDILKEYTIQNETIVPHDAAMKIFVDTVEFCRKEMPRWYPVSISGYHIREGGSTAAQELAFTLADGRAYVAACMERGLDVDDFAPYFTFFFNACPKLFEEVGKYRAARRMWARIMRDEFGAKRPESRMMRFHTQTSGVSLTAQQQDNNVIRSTIEALAGVLGGTQSMHVNAKDEALSLPSDLAAVLALRTQQIIAYESGVADVADPLGGSYYVEGLTNELERQAREYIRRIDDMGGMVEATKVMYPRSEIDRAAVEHQRRIDLGEEKIVGVNIFVEDEPQWIEFRGNPNAEEVQLARLNAFRKKRKKRLLRQALDAVRKAAEEGENVMYPVITAVDAGATVGEVVIALQDVYGEYIERGIV